MNSIHIKRYPRLLTLDCMRIKIGNICDTLERINLAKFLSDVVKYRIMPSATFLFQ